MSDSLTLTAVFTPDENGWTTRQLAAREMIYSDERREPPIGGGHVEALTIDLAA
jgi:hypothetical protein